MRRTTTTKIAASMLLSVALAFGGVPAAALAQDDAPATEEQVAEVAPPGVDVAALDDAAADDAAPAEDAAIDDVDAAEDAAATDETGVVADEQPAAAEDEDAQLGAETLVESGDTDGELTAEASTPHVQYRVHVQTYGNQGWRKDGKTAGTSGKSKRLEGIWLKVTNAPCAGGIQYRTHVQTYGWQGWRANGKMSGTSGKAKRLEAINIRLTGELADRYDVWYRVHAQTFGWMGWAKNGIAAGTAGYAKRLEAIQIRILPKGSKAPGKTANPFRQKGATKAAALKALQGWWGFSIRRYDGSYEGYLHIQGRTVAQYDEEHNKYSTTTIKDSDLTWQTYAENENGPVYRGGWYIKNAFGRSAVSGWFLMDGNNKTLFRVFERDGLVSQAGASSDYTRLSGRPW